MLIAVVGLIVIGPARLPETLRTLGLWMGRLRRSFVSVKTEIEKEIGMDDIRRQLHNEAVMEEMRKIEEEVKSSVDPAISLNEGPPLYSDDTPPRSAEEKTESPTASTTDEVDEETDAKTDVATEEFETDQVTIAPPVENVVPEPAEATPATPLPRSEAELEALHEARQKRLKEADSS